MIKLLLAYSNRYNYRVDTLANHFDRLLIEGLIDAIFTMSLETAVCSYLYKIENNLDEIAHDSGLNSINIQENANFIDWLNKIPFYSSL